MTKTTTIERLRTIANQQYPNLLHCRDKLIFFPFEIFEEKKSYLMIWS